MRRRKLCGPGFLAIFGFAVVLCVCAAHAQNIPTSGPTTPSPDRIDQPVSNELGESDDPATVASGHRTAPRDPVLSGADLHEDAQSNRTRTREELEDRRSSKAVNSLPPDPPTEFQQMVLNSIGRSLPIYGASMFRDVPTTFAPLDRVPVTPSYVIGPGDELLLRAWGQITLDTRVTVDRAGEIYLPQVGSVRVAGLAFEQLQGYMQSQIGRVFRNFDLNVNLGQLRSIQVFVLGQARRPGSYTISSLSTLVDALFATGGPTPQGSLRHIELKRSGKTIADFDLYDLLQRGDKSGDVPLLPGDVIYIPPAGPQVAVAGSVNTPAIYELKSPATSTVEEVLALAAGPTSVADTRSVRLERVEAQSARSVTQLPLDAVGRATAVREGDILELVAIVDRYTDGVILRGNVANPGRYRWRPGMRVGDLFPEKDALVTRSYWLKRGRLGQPTLDYIPACDPSFGTDAAKECAGALTVASAVVSAAGRQGPETTEPSHVAAASAAAAAIGPRSQARLEPHNDIILSEPDIDWSYAVVERRSEQTLTTSLLPFNLGRLVLDGDRTQDIELYPGDVVTIFSKADIRVPQSQQTRLVYLEGEFASSGVYSVLPGETLQQLVARAGGLSPDAYLYGSEFTRESTRRVQQQRMDEYINQIELKARSTPAGRSLTAQDIAVESAQQAQAQSLVDRLRQAKSSGRIVLDLKPDARLVAEIPPIPLEDGDRFIVPQVPSTVSVAGAVYNPNSFLYDERHRLRSYLDIAGGANRDADTRRMYVIRADGSVVSRQQSSTFDHHRFEALRIFPGDTIIVPVNLNRGARLRNIVDLSQIVGQFGLALAAANLVF